MEIISIFFAMLCILRNEYTGCGREKRNEYAGCGRKKKFIHKTYRVWLINRKIFVFSVVPCILRDEYTGCGQEITNIQNKNIGCGRKIERISMFSVAPLLQHECTGYGQESNGYTERMYRVWSREKIKYEMNTRGAIKKATNTLNEYAGCG